jgi:hypothetical protein
MTSQIFVAGKRGRNVRYQERQGRQRDIGQIHAQPHIPLPCRCLVLRDYTEAAPIGAILHSRAQAGFAKRNPPYGLSRSKLLGDNGADAEPFNRHCRT